MAKCYGPECQNQEHSGGLCQSHVKQLRTKGALSKLAPRAKPVQTCDFEDCERPGYVKYRMPTVLCLNHRRQEVAGHRLMSLLCDVEGCRKDSTSLGYCKNHYNNFRNHGTPVAPPRKVAEVREPRRKPRIDVFNSKWEPGEGGCHLWTGFVSKNGQCVFSEGQYQISPQRWIYQYGLPEGEEMPEMVRQRCKVTRCVNREHLYGATRAEVAAEWHILRRDTE